MKKHVYCIREQKMFNINKRSAILFYGFSRFDMVKNKYYDMLEQGYNILGYIDKNAETLSKSIKIPCWSLDNLPYKKKERKEIIVIILLQNGQLHEKIALVLEKSGFSKILFLPALYVTEEQKRMCILYNHFLEGNFGQLENIPEIHFIMNMPEKQRQIISTSEQFKIVFVPTELLFMYQEDVNGERCNVKYDRNYRELFAFLEGKTETCDNYLKFMGVKTRKEQIDLLTDREKLYFKFENEYNLESDYFVWTAANVQWNKNGYFNIIDGHHRIEFLIYKGYRSIPVRISKTDFELWENKKQLEKCRNKELLENIFCPILHPRFLDAQVFFLPMWQKVETHLLNFIFNHNDEVLDLIEIDMHYGYFSRLCRLLGGISPYIGITNVEQKQLCEWLNDLLWQENIMVMNYEQLLQQGAQIVYVDSRLVDIGQLKKLIYHEKCMYVFVETDIIGKKEVIDVLEERFRKKARLICWANVNKRIGIYGIGEEKWQK